MTATSVRLREWSCLDADNEPALRGRRLGRDPAVRKLAEQLSFSRRLGITELASGLRLEATSWVGRVELGDLTIAIEPKLPLLPLLDLLRYAFGWRRLHILAETDFNTAGGVFLDLLIAQLAADASELLARGLHRDYVRTSADLTSPRGRIDFQRYSAAAATTARLPCIHHPRQAATDLNGLLLAGLRHAADVASSLELRVRLRRLAARLALDLSPRPLTRAGIADGQRGLDRRTVHYASILALLNLILEGQSVTLDAQLPGIRLNGFMLDMNAFFQALIGRFLTEHIDDGEVLAETQLHGLFTYASDYNPRQRRHPQPRPDFVIRRQRASDIILDAKYRDLWQRSLPREMLYQLAIYALAQGGAQASATILYPSFDQHTRDQVVVFNDVLRGMPKARVILRAVNLLQVRELLGRAATRAAERERQELARQWVFGHDPL